MKRAAVAAPPKGVATATKRAKKQNAHAVNVYTGESVKGVKFSPNGLTIVSCGVDKTIKVWGAGVTPDTIPSLSNQ